MATSEYRDPRAEFGDALKAAGLVVEEAPVMDGKFHRVPVEGAKNGTRDGSYVGFMDGKPSGYIENFKTGHKENWSAAGAQLTGQERAEAAAQMQIARQQRADETATQQRQTAEKVLVKWDGLSDVPPTGQNAYLSRKGVEAHGVKFDGDRLVVPVRDIDGKLWSVQSIPPEEGAAKMFERGGRKGANMHVIGEIEPGAEVLVAEGYATGASLHQATGKTVAVAFDAGNLDAVVGAIRQRHPAIPVYIMGDNDRSQQPNVGFDKAMAAAQKHQVGVAFPQFQEPGKLSDFNDLHAKEGLGAVKAQVEKATSLSMEQSRARVGFLAATAARPPTPEREVSVPVLDAAVTERSPLPSAPEAQQPAIRDDIADATQREAGEQLTARDGVVGVAHVAQVAQVGGPVAHVAVQAIGVTDALKVTSDVAQGKEVKALDVASAAASVAMTAGVGGPAVQLGAQAIAGISAVDAGQRTLNTVEAKLKEPDPVDVAQRNAIERRNAEVLVVPRDGLDAQPAREAVKQDIASLREIENPQQHRTAAAAMSQTAENQSSYKAELARQDPATAEVVALASKSAAVQPSAPAAAVTPIDDRQRVSSTAEARPAEQQPAPAKDEGKVADAMASPAKAQTNTIQYVLPQQIQGLARAVQPQVDPEAERVRARNNAVPLEDRFNIVPRFARGRDYHFRDQPGKVAFQERWRSMTSTVDTPAVVKAMVDRAQERGWETLRVKGSEEFMRQAWIAANARGIKAVGYDPTAGDRAAAAEERARLGREPSQSPVQRGGAIRRDVMQDRSAAPLASAPERPPARPAVEQVPVERKPEAAKAAPRQDAETPIAAPLRSFLTERGVTAAEVEATVALASARMPRDRVHVGQLVSHGVDHYEFDKKNEANYYVKLQTPAGEKVVWGVDLRRAVEESRVKAGDSITLEHRGIQPVTVMVKDRDASNKVVGEHAEVVKRNSWHVADIEQLRKEALRLEPARAPSPEPRRGRAQALLAGQHQTG